MVNVGNPSVVVDDQSPQVQYTGSWGKGGSAPEFTGTTSYALAKGATATFRFDGTSVSVFGTVDPGSIGYTFVVDDSHQGSYNPPASPLPGSESGGASYHQAFYESPILTAGEHTLVITSTGEGDIGLFLDYFVYTPSPARSSTGLTYIVDDDAAGRGIEYLNWRKTTPGLNLGHTSHFSAGRGAKVTFTFEGTSVSIMGDLPSQITQTQMATISVDNGSPTSFAPPARNETLPAYGQKFFESGSLSQGNHTVVLTTTGSEVLAIDYFLVVPGDITRPGNALPSGSGSDSAPLPTSSRSAKGSEGSSGTPDENSGDNSRSNVGAIAGGVVGSVAALAILAFVVFWFMRRRRPAEAISHRQSSFVIGGPATPYPPSSNMSFHSSARNPNDSVSQVQPFDSWITPATYAAATQYSHSVPGSSDYGSSQGEHPQRMEQPNNLRQAHGLSAPPPGYSSY